MRSHKRLALFSLVNYLLALFLIIPIGVFIEQLCALPLGRCCFLPCFCLLAYATGRWSMSKQPVVAIAASIISTIVVMVCVAILTPASVLAKVLFLVVAAFFSVFFFFSARRAGYTIYAPMSITGILVHIVILFLCTGYQYAEQAITLASTSAIIFFLLTLYSFSAQGLRKSLHKGITEKRVVFPAGMQMGNFLLVTGFIIIAAFISNIHPIFQIFSTGFVSLIRNIFIAINNFKKLFAHKGPLIEEEESSSSNTENENIMTNNEPKGEAAAVTAGVQIFSFIIVVILLLFVLFKVYQRLRKAGLRLPAFMRNLRDRFNPVTDEDYIDETESLFDTGRLLNDTGKRIRDTFSRIRQRPQKIGDFSDNRLKIRFLYQQLLKKQLQEDSTISGKTPNELYKQCFNGNSEARAFIDDYNLARYANRQVSDDAVTRAEKLIRQKR